MSLLDFSSGLCTCFMLCLQVTASRRTLATGQVREALDLYQGTRCGSCISLIGSFVLKSCWVDVLPFLKRHHWQAVNVGALACLEGVMVLKVTWDSV